VNVLLSIKNLTVRFYTYDGTVTALNNINLNINEGETYGIVGETGCGKTMTALSILRLVPPPGLIDSGIIEFHYQNGKTIDLLSIPESEMRDIRGNKIAMIFQEPNSALNPVYTIGDQISEAILLHRRSAVVKKITDDIDKAGRYPGWLNKLLAPVTRPYERYIYRMMTKKLTAYLPRIIGSTPLLRNLLWRTKLVSMEMAIKLLKDVEIPDSERIAKQYPHELSGGMKQRSVIAMSLACNPKLLIADEPTTALDVTIQAQILDLLRNLKKEHEASILYITHDLGVAAEICDRIGVMYCGNICEEAPVEEIYAKPLHPYTQALMAAVPKPGQEFKSISGFLPSLIGVEDRCQFQPRCSQCRDICKEQSPGTREVSPGHFVSCHLV
jgi:peptide/nickel transport system ATP-binding protein